MEYVASDFDGLLLNVYNHPLGTNLQGVFPILTKYPEFMVQMHSQFKRERVLRYVIYAFDRNSPLTAITDILERRVEAATLAGFEPNSVGIFTPAIDKMIRSLNPLVNHMVIRYCMLMGDIDYSVMVTYEDALVKELDRLINFGVTKTPKVHEGEDKVDAADGNEKKKELIDNISKLRASINELRAEFFAKNVDYFLSRSLMEFSESKKVDLSPEFYAVKMKGWDNISRYYIQLNPHITPGGFNTTNTALSRAKNQHEYPQ